MNRASERRAVDEALEALDRVTGSIDAGTVRDLDAARRRGLRGSGFRARPSHWLGAAAGVAALALVIGIEPVDRNEVELAPLTEQLVTDAELYQELEFYEWLSGVLESD